MTKKLVGLLLGGFVAMGCGEDRLDDEYHPPAPRVVTIVPLECDAYPQGGWAEIVGNYVVDVPAGVNVRESPHELQARDGRWVLIGPKVLELRDTGNGVLARWTGEGTSSYAPPVGTPASPGCRADIFFEY